MNNYSLARPVATTAITINILDTRIRFAVLVLRLNYILIIFVCVVFFLVLLEVSFSVTIHSVSTAWPVKPPAAPVFGLTLVPALTVGQTDHGTCTDGWSD